MNAKALYVLFLIVILANCKNKGGSLVSPESSSVFFSTDKRIETLYFVFLLSDYPLVTTHSSGYKTSVLHYFDKYRDHQAVLLAKELTSKGFSFDYAVNWVYQHSDFPALEKSYEVSFPFHERKISPDSLERFREELVRFYHQTNCDGFFTVQHEFLEQMVDRVEGSFGKKNIIGVIEDYYGVKKDADYYVILSPLLHSGGFSIERSNLHDKKKELYAVIGPSGLKDSLPEFDKVFLEQDMVIHEFSHNYANPIVEKFIHQTASLEQAVYNPVKKKVKEEGYDSYEAFLYELIVRATTLRIVEIVYGEEEAEQLLEYEKSAGFASIEKVAEALKKYEKQRDKYPSLEEFFPEIINSLVIRE